ncbi:hypothetical protein GGF47_004763, partial [Coemansia sp. RSA 2524]
FSGVLSEAHDKTLLEEMVARVVAEDRRIIVTEESTGNDVLRVVQVDGFVANPCGGTHVRSTAELGHVTIRKIARRAGQNLTKISYCVA